MTYSATKSCTGSWDTTNSRLKLFHFLIFVFAGQPHDVWPEVLSLRQPTSVHVFLQTEQTQSKYNPPISWGRTDAVSEKED